MRARTPGTTVCATHGSRAPQVQRKIKMRFAELVDPAVAAIARVLVQTTDDRTKLKAAEMILDRAGFPARMELSVEDSRELLAERLIELRQERLDAEAAAYEALEPGDEETDGTGADADPAEPADDFETVDETDPNEENAE